MRETAYLEGNDKILERLRGIPFLSSLDDKHLKELLKVSKLRQYETGELITPEGTYDSWIYILLTGEVGVLKNDKEVARLNVKGDTFGELAIIDGEARSASVMALCDTNCLAVDASFVDRVEVNERDAFFSVFYRVLAELLARRLRTTSHELMLVKKELEQYKK